MPSTLEVVSEDLKITVLGQGLVKFHSNGPDTKHYFEGHQVSFQLINTAIIAQMQL